MGGMAHARRMQGRQAQAQVQAQIARRPRPPFWTVDGGRFWGPFEG